MRVSLVLLLGTLALAGCTTQVRTYEPVTQVGAKCKADCWQRAGQCIGVENCARFINGCQDSCRDLDRVTAEK